MAVSTKRFLILGILFLVIAISGCAGRQPSLSLPSQFPGVIITQFIADSYTIDAGERTTVEADFENIGDATATGITGILLRKGAFLVEPLLPQKATDLDPPVEETPSGDAFLWHLTAPTVTADRVEDVQARIYYNYTTQGFATINFVPRDILREKGERSFPVESSVTLGPLDMEIVAVQPYVIRDKKETSARVRVTFTTENVGPGTVESLTDKPIGSCDKGLNCIDEITVAGFGSSCIDAKTNLPIAKTYSGVRLVEGIEGKFTDTYTFALADPNAATSCQLRATAKYRYRVDSEILSIGIAAIQ